MVETINRLIGLLRKHGIDERADIARMVASGNTVMSHLLLGIEPTRPGRRAVPAGQQAARALRAGEIGLAIHPAARVEMAPATAGYIGGDISGMDVCGATGRELTLLVDIGTNAEIIVGKPNGDVACAAPAGPAFEGSGLSCGMRAGTGRSSDADRRP